MSARTTMCFGLALAITFMATPASRADVGNLGWVGGKPATATGPGGDLPIRLGLEIGSHSIATDCTGCEEPSALAAGATGSLAIKSSKLSPNATLEFAGRGGLRGMYRTEQGNDFGSVGLFIGPELGISFQVLNGTSARPYLFLMPGALHLFGNSGLVGDDLAKFATSFGFGIDVTPPRFPVALGLGYRRVSYTLAQEFYYSAGPFNYSWGVQDIDLSESGFSLTLRLLGSR